MIYHPGAMLLLLGPLLAAVVAGAGAEKAAACAAGAAEGSCPWALDTSDAHSEVSLLQRTSRSLGADDATKVAVAAEGQAAATQKSNASSEQAAATAERGHTGDAGNRSFANVSRHEQAASASGPPALTNVLEAFNKVEYEGSKMAFYTGSLFPEGYDDKIPPYSEHFQTVLRLRDSRYLAVAGAAHAAGNIFIIDIASAPSTQGMWGSNLKKGFPASKDDKVVAVIDVSKDLPHAGGLGLWGDVIAVPVEEACGALEGLTSNACPSISIVYFYSVANPLAPRKLPYKIERQGLPGGAASLIQESDGTFLLMVGQKHSYTLDFYRSLTKDLDVDDPGWTLIGTWEKSALKGSSGCNWDTSYGKYQNTNMIRQADGKLYFAGTTRDVPVIGWDWLDLYEMDMSPPAAPFKLEVTKVASKKLLCKDNVCDFYAGAGVFVNSPSEMYVYGIDWIPYNGVVSMMEFGASSSCPKDTGGTCFFGTCSATRTGAVCDSMACVCPEGTCAVNGACKST
mmetsp:Transcript_49388/g.127461  ORF Transcript_49388/g.127461 Transcript_49388/m.127461 type:complete len:511 (+) Transcript_49388:53-1585(+)